MSSLLAENGLAQRCHHPPRTTSSNSPQSETLTRTRQRQEARHPRQGKRCGTAPPRRRSRWYFLLLMVALVAVVFIVVEARTSFYVQSPVLSRLVAGMGFAAAPGPSPRILFPASGPYDQRLGYTHLPQWIAGLQARGYAIEEQAVLSPQLDNGCRKGRLPPLSREAAGRPGDSGPAGNVRVLQPLSARHLRDIRGDPPADRLDARFHRRPWRGEPEPAATATRRLPGSAWGRR